MTAPAPQRPLRSARRLVLGLSLGLALTVVAGCTGGQSAADPTMSGTASPTPTTSASPEPTTPATTAPPWTPAMNEVGVDAALAVGQYFLELFPYVHSTGDTTEWRRLSAQGCTFCTDVTRAAEDPPEGGYEEATVAVSAVQGVEVSPGVYSLEYQMVFVSASRPEGETDSVSMVLLRDAETWSVRGVDISAEAAGA